MDRLFTRSTTAQYVKLEKNWDFCIDEKNIGNKEKWYEAFPENCIKMPVPSCWNTTLGYFRYSGVAWYRTYFECFADSVNLQFDAVSNECDIYIDGNHIGYHYGAFAEFCFDALDIGSGIHELVVRVDNTANLTDTVPHLNSDWYNYGGINRPVIVTELYDYRVKNFEVRYTLDDERKNATLNLNIDLWSQKPVTDKLLVLVNGECVYTGDASADGNTTVSIDSINLADIELWDIGKPNLYYVTVVFGGEDLTDRIGFRTIETKGKDVYLNGRKIKLIGVCRHEIHPDWGFTMPFELIKKDIDIIRDLNCNAVRAAHYPHCKITVDYCDQVGLLYWEEIPVWGNLPQWQQSLEDEKFVNRILYLFKAMMQRDINHPSIIFWGLYNEIDTSWHQTRALTQRMVKIAKEYDPSRLTSYATCSIHVNVEQDICSDLVDVVSFNYYTGWIPSSEIDSHEEFVARMRKLVDKNANGRPMPMMMSEFGGAGIKGQWCFETQRWSENYQCVLLKKCIDVYLGSDEMCGGFIWQFCNVQTQPHYEYMRSGGVNNKGLLDEYRRPKASFEMVKQLYCELNPDSNNVTEIKIF